MSNIKKKKSEEFNPSEEDMLDAWFIYQTTSQLKEKLKIEKDKDMIKDLNSGLRLLLSQDNTKRFVALEIIERLYKSWEQKSLMAPDIKKQLKNKKMDQISAYSYAISQTVIVTFPQDEKDKEKFFKKRRQYSNRFSKRIKNMKTDHYYVQVFLTPEGEIYIDYSIKNEKNKLIFKRVPANQFYGNDDNLDRNIKVEVEKLNFYLQKDGLRVENTPIDMITREREISSNLKLAEIYYFTTTNKISMQKNDNIGLLSFEDFLTDKDIEESEKEMVVSFFNGEGINI
jgi:hypothetical protein